MTNWTPLPKPGTKWRQFRHDCAIEVVRDLFEQCGLPRVLYAPIAWRAGGGLEGWLSGTRYPQGVTSFCPRPVTEPLFDIPDPLPKYTGNTTTEPLMMNNILKALWPPSRIENLIFGPAEPLTKSHPHWFREKTTACSPVKVDEPPDHLHFNQAGATAAQVETYAGVQVPGLPRV